MTESKYAYPSLANAIRLNSLEGMPPQSSRLREIEFLFIVGN